MSPVDSRASNADVPFPSAECKSIAATTIQKLGFVLGLAAAPGCGMGMDDTIVVMTNFTTGASNSVGSDSRTSDLSGTDSNSSTSRASDTDGTSMTDASTATSVSTHSTGTSTTGETAATTDMVTSGTSGDACLRGIECVNGNCMVIDGVEQCVCNNLCFKGGSSDCFSECAEGCYDQNNNPANPDCVQIDPEILPPPTFWGSKAFKAYQSQAPFFKQGMTDKQTQFLMVDIDGGLSKPIEAPIFDPNVPNWDGYWGGNSEQFVLPTYDGIPYKFCLRAVKNGPPSAPVCFDVTGDPN